MKHIRRMSACLALVAAFIGPGLAEGAVLKCDATKSGLSVDLSRTSLVVNGQTVGTLGVEGREGRPGDVFLSEVVPNSADVVRVDVVCLEIVEGDRRIGHQAVSVITRSGAVDFMTSHLRALSDLQEEHRASHGAYAESLAELGFFQARVPLPIEFTSGPNGWTARATVESVSNACHVYAGAPADVADDQPPNVVECLPT